MRRLSHGGTRCPQRVGKVTAALPPDVLAPSAIPLPSVRAGLAFSGEADPLGRTGTRCPQRVGRRLRLCRLISAPPAIYLPSSSEKPIHPSPSAQKCNELAKLPVRAPRELASMFREFPHENSNLALRRGTRMRCWAWTRCRSLSGRRTRRGRWRRRWCWRRCRTRRPARTHRTIEDFH
jgi:hypothetical protein